MRDFLLSNASALLIALALLVCTGIYGCETRYAGHVSGFHGYTHVTVIDRWTGRVVP
jgi:hypothetical protein